MMLERHFLQVEEDPSAESLDMFAAIAGVGAADVAAWFAERQQHKGEQAVHGDMAAEFWVAREEVLAALAPMLKCRGDKHLPPAGRASPEAGRPRSPTVADSSVFDKNLVWQRGVEARLAGQRAAGEGNLAVGYEARLRGALAGQLPPDAPAESMVLCPETRAWYAPHAARRPRRGAAAAVTPPSGHRASARSDDFLSRQEGWSAARAAKLRQRGAELARARDAELTFEPDLLHFGDSQVDEVLEIDIDTSSSIGTSG
jgi:hypothetical protein